ncbi:MAG: sialate O-acetylesterase [Nannocystales bacterium]
MRASSIVGALLLVGCGGAGGSSETDTDTDASSGGAVTQGSTGSVATGSETASTTDLDSSGSSESSGAAPNQPPTAVIEVARLSGLQPWTVELDGSLSSDPDGDVVVWSWDWPSGEATGETASFDPSAEGCADVTLEVTDDDGAVASAVATVSTLLAPPPKTATATLLEMPLASAVLPRDLVTNEGTARFVGTLDTDGFGEVRANVFADGVQTGSFSVPVCGAAPFSFELEVPIVAGLQAYDVQLVAAVGDLEAPLAEVTDLVSGDIYLINGQSNAFAAMYNGDANVNQTPFLRSFGINVVDPSTTADTVAWFPAQGNGSNAAGSIGQWAIRMANVLSEAHEVPVAVINGSLGGQPIGYFERNDEDPVDLATNYGRLLYRMQAAGLTDDVRAILWYQGESDGEAWEAHSTGFEALIEDWSEDYPDIEQLYVTQLREGCGGNHIRTREWQRTLPDTMDGVTVMSTNGLDGHDGCHYAYAEGYEVLGERYAALLGRDLYAETPAADVQPPNPMSATLEDDGMQIVISLRNADEPMTYDPGAEADFVVEGSAVTVVGGSAEAGEVRLMLSGPATDATGITYRGHVLAGPWITSETGLGMLSFWNLPLR